MIDSDLAIRRSTPATRQLQKVSTEWLSKQSLGLLRAVNVPPEMRAEFKVYSLPALPQKFLAGLLLCALCDSVVDDCSGKNNHRVTESTEKNLHADF